MFDTAKDTPSPPAVDSSCKPEGIMDYDILALDTKEVRTLLSSLIRVSSSAINYALQT